MNRWDSLAVGVVLVSWLMMGLNYHYMFERWLRWWAWPFALGACLFARRMAGWEVGGQSVTDERSGDGR